MSRVWRASDFPSRPEASAESGRSLQVHGQIGHAWFARSARSMPVPLGRPASSLPAFRHAEDVLAARARPVSRRPVRVPDDAIIAVRSHLPPPTGPQIEFPPRSAEPDGAPSKPSRLLAVLRQLFFLAVLAATLACTFYIGRKHAFHNVIIVPESWSPYTTLT